MDEDSREEDIMEEEENGQAAKKRKMSTGRIVLIVVIAVVVLLLILFIFLFRSRSRNMVAENTVSQTEAAIGDISLTIDGTGTLQSGTVTDVEVPAGVTIDEVKVESGDIVKRGDVLATVKEGSVASALLEIRDELDTVDDQLDNLSDDDDTTTYLESIVLNAEYSDLKQAESDLEYLLDTLQITATVDGTISAISVSDDTEVTAGGSAGGGSSSASDAAESYAGALSAMSATSDDTATLQFLTATAPAEEEDTGDGAAEIQTYSDEIQYLDDPGEESEPTAITSEFVIPVTPPVTGAEPEKELGEIKDADENVLVKESSITWDCSTEKFQADTTYTATIILKAADGYVFDYDNLIPVVEGATVRFYRFYNENEILYLQATFAATESDTKKDDSSGTDSGTSKSGVTGSGSGSSGGTSSISGSGLTGSTGSAANGLTADAGTDAVVETVSGTQLADYNAYEATAFSLASGSEMKVSISVDELDILDVKEGQTAEITMDALEGQTFNGRITKVSTTASSTGGSAKYAVEITMNKTEDMMVGMNASATIYAEEAKDVLKIPVSALQESGNKTFVYTKSDDEGNLSGEVEVTTGLSDGQEVEIKSGLSAGDTVYYLRSESTDSSLFNMFGGMGGGMGGGNAPDDRGEGRGDMGGGMGPGGN